MVLNWEGGGAEGWVDGVQIRVQIALRPRGIVVVGLDAVAEGGLVANLDLAAGPYESRDELVGAVRESVQRWKSAR